MTEEKRKRAGWAYLRYRAGVLVLFAVFCGIFALVLALYQLPAEAVGYAALLCAALGAVAAAVDFLAFSRRHRQLRDLRDTVVVSLERLPEPQSLPEQDYQELLRTLYEDRVWREDEAEHRYADAVEYYTAWAHQIKTPIAAMRLILQNEQPARERELSGELQRVEQYVDMVLCYLRLNSDTTDYVIKEYDLDWVVRQAVRRYAPQFIRRKIRLSYRPLDCTVLTDEKWLLFVVEQVLSNALKYTRAQGSVAIALEEPKTLVIADTGIGIAPEDLPRVFERGYTGYNGRRDQRATGIGLYLCRRILTRMGHRISLESVPGRGTTVRIGLDSSALEIE